MGLWEVFGLAWDFDELYCLLLDGHLGEHTLLDLLVDVFYYLLGDGHDLGLYGVGGHYFLGAGDKDLLELVDDGADLDELVAVDGLGDLFRREVVHWLLHLDELVAHYRGALLDTHLHALFVDFVCVDHLLHDVGLWAEDLLLLELLNKHLFDELFVLDLFLDDVPCVSKHDFLLDFDGFLDVDGVYFWLYFGFVENNLFFNDLRHLYDIFDDFSDLYCPLLDNLHGLLMFIGHHNLPIPNLHIPNREQLLHNLLHNSRHIPLHHHLHRYPPFHLHLLDDLGFLLHHHNFLFLDCLIDDLFDGVGGLLFHDLFHLVCEVDWHRFLELDYL